ncbi:hypothetical protein BDV95DRAFT_586755 [Massariosphaeria phaeospora]|uniref:Uncharacterized protein n=1 Tax=Massariosphaeria phaeospora TaxID=100035 RepID=A0A7C8HYT0_9PLEO|nr:hypothetical protein BDV95DRAFT_586755 [Massariosphaeria phaeospora]
MQPASLASTNPKTMIKVPHPFPVLHRTKTTVFSAIPYFTRASRPSRNCSLTHKRPSPNQRTRAFPLALRASPSTTSLELPTLPNQPPHSNLSTSAIAKMSDQDYTAFLDKANQDTGSVTTQQSKSYGTKSVNTEVPKVLQSVEEYYVSDADEPFEPVALKFGGGEITAEKLKELLGHDADVSSVAAKDFDPKGQYKSVVEAVQKAGNGQIQVFRVEHGGTRAEYYVVSVDEKEGVVVGLKALSVES